MLTQDDVIYFVMTDRFCNGDSENDTDTDISDPHAFHGGDFAGLKQKIPYFKKLGITAVWITPVYLNITDHYGSAGYHGYWAMDFERVDLHLYTKDPTLATGNRAFLKDLVATLKGAGLKVILDMVVNHTGYHTPEYEQYANKRFNDSHFNDENSKGMTKQQLSGLPDLNHDLCEVGDYFVQNILDWIDDTGIDGIRMDTVKHVEDTFWYLFKSQIKTSRPGITLLGEVLEYDPAVIGSYQQKHDFDTLFDFPLTGALKGALIWDLPMTTIARPRLHPDEPKGALDFNRMYTNANRLVTFLDNHDMDRRITTEIFDHVGHWDKDLARKILKLCLSFIFTIRGIPQIYYGTEIGMQGRSDPDNRRDMPWDIFGQDSRPMDEYLFEQDIFDYTAKMIELRSDNPAIRCGYLFTLYADHFIFAYMREFRGNVVIVVINNGHDAMPLPLTIEMTGNSNIPPRIHDVLCDGTVLASMDENLEDIIVSSGCIHAQLPGKTAGIYTK